ncbi:MAG: DUF2029 domain-containing protein [Chloroflexota bacterium]|nr:DUF2029 domain-containing protein [Chloroflexota bacterium]
MLREQNSATKSYLENLAQSFLTVFVYFLISLVTVLNLISIQPALGGLLDFGSFISAGKAAQEGKNPYTTDSPLVFQVESQNTDQTLSSPNLNPPVSIIFFRPLADIDPSKAVSAWRVISAVMFVAGVFILARSYPKFTNPIRILWAFNLAGFWNTIALGQIYAPVFLLAIGVWIFTEKGYSKLAGIMLGIIIAIKPNFIFWLLLLGFAGQITTIFSAAATVLLLSLWPVALFGPQIYQQWLTALSNYPSIGLLIAGNSSLQSLSARFGSAIPGIVMSVFLFGVSLYLARRNKYSPTKINTLGIAGSLLISPFSWAGYTILTLPILFSKSRWNWLHLLAAVILAFPYLLILYLFQKSLFNSVLFGWLYGWGLLLMLVESIINQDEDKSGLQRVIGHEK